MEKRRDMHHDTDFISFSASCSRTDSFAELIPLALEELKKFSDGAEIVCGPISTGGRGNIDENVRVFSLTIRALQAEGRPIFSQIPYEERIFFFRKRWQDSDPANNGKYYLPILEEFYRPIMEAGRIRKAWFIPGWESSFGARWERERLTENGAEIQDLSEEWIEELLKKNASV